MESMFAPGSFSLNPKEVRSLDEALCGRWGVDLVETRLDLESVLDNHPDPELRRIAVSALGAARQALAKGGGETAFYNAMSDRRLIGLATSARRAYILDSAAFVASFLRTAEICGSVLDVGCHAGVVMDILHDITLNRFHGIDPVASAIDLAREKTVDRVRLTFEVGTLKATSSEKYELVYCIDSMPSGRHARGLFLKAVREHLKDSGYALIVSQHWVSESSREIRDQLKNLGLGFIFADVVGGWGGMPNAFSAEGFVVLQKNSGGSFPGNIRDRVEALWPVFAPYANDSSTPSREKTQAYFRARGNAESPIKVPSENLGH